MTAPLFFGGQAATFEEGEKILAFHGPQIYEGKVVKVEDKPDYNGKSATRYLTHYNGWNKSWDEWLAPDRMMKHTAENLERQQALIAQAKREKKRNPPPGGTKGSSKTDEPSSKRRRGDRGAAAAAEAAEPAETVQVPMPDNLKLKLIDDWNFITRHGKVVSLPRKESISDLLDRYCGSVSGAAASSLALEVTSGLKAYFESACGPLLLYKEERVQFKEITESKPDSDLASLYGPEHLLRLLLKLPTLISHAGIDERGLAHISLCVQDVMKFMLSQEEQLFPLEVYVNSE